LKYLFAVVLVLLLIASVAVHQGMPDQGEVPTLRWATEQGEVREGQRRVFDSWIKKQHADDPKNFPLFNVQIDPANNRNDKLIIQGVAGVASDLFSGSRGGFRSFQSIGLLEDITDVAKAKGFSYSETYPPLYWEITRNGRQYGYPMNVTVPLFITNARAFRQFGVETPKNGAEWTIEEFEALGVKYVTAARQELGRRAYFVDKYEPLVLRRSFGLATFNETGTRSVLDDPRYVHTLKLLHRWTHDLNIMPTSGEAEAIAGAGLQNFVNGVYGMIYDGSWWLEALRPNTGRFNQVVHGFSDGDMIGVPPPKPAGPEGMTNTILRTRVCSIYAGGKHRDLAAVFMQYLASDDYSKELVTTPDSLPPNPHMTDPANPESELFYRPVRMQDGKNVLQYEWQINPVFVHAVWEWAVGTNYSDFVLPDVVSRIETLAIKDMIANRRTPEQTATLIHEGLQAEIAKTINADPRARAKYDELRALQQKIDERRAAGQKVPVAWLQDPFYQRYYLHRGWAEGEARINVPVERRYKK